jgi:hypothetical protein
MEENTGKKFHFGAGGMGEKGMLFDLQSSVNVIKVIKLWRMK